MEIADRSGEVAGLDVHWLEAGARPVLYLHGVPTASWEWLPFLERTGGIAPDLPGFGRSAKPGDFDYSIAGYDRFLEQFSSTSWRSSASRSSCTTGAAWRSPSRSASPSGSSAS